MLQTAILADSPNIIEALLTSSISILDMAPNESGEDALFTAIKSKNSAGIALLKSKRI